MKTKPLKGLVSVGLCVLTLCVFGDRSFSDDTVISVLPPPDNPFMKSDSGESPGWDPGIFGLPESADLSGTALDRTTNQAKVPLMLSIGIHDKDGNYITEGTDWVQVSLWHQWMGEWEDNPIDGERFIVVVTPWGGVYSFIPETYLYLFRNYYVMEGIVGNSFKVEQALNHDRHYFLEQSLLGLPLGVYTFYAGVDAERNDKVDTDSLVMTRATLRLINPISVSLTASPLSGKAPLEVDFQVIVKDPKGTADTCSLVVGDQRAGCAMFNKMTLMEGTHKAWAEVKDKFGRYVTSDPFTITVSPPAQNQPPTITNLTVTPAAVYSYDESFTIHYDYDDPDGKDDVKTNVIGIGVWSQTYAAGGSGQFQRSYNFGEGTTPGDHYIDAYVIDSEGNYSNTLSSSVYFGGGSKPCGTFTEAGSDAAETHYVEMGQTSGYFWFEHETFTQEDRITIYYENDPVPIFDSGCIGTNGTESHHIKFGPGNSTKIMVHVEPNCAGGSGTRWNFTVRCPTVGPY